jgi:hypothetical protein
VFNIVPLAGVIDDLQADIVALGDGTADQPAARHPATA